MQLRWHAIAGLIFLITANACTGMNNGTPTGPSAPPASFQPTSPSNEVTPASGRGTIAGRRFSPGPGATLAVHDNCLSGSVTRRCTNDWHGTLDVVVDREMTYPVLVVSFYEGSKLCGYAAGTRDVVPADIPVSFDLSRIVLSDEFGTFTQPCQLPLTTTRLVAQLWSDSSSWSNTLMQELPATTYKFAEP